MLITLRNVVFFLISNIVVDLLDQQQIFSQMYLIESPGLLAGLGLLELWHLIYPRHWHWLVFFTNLGLMEFQVRYLALFLLFSVKDGFEWFWMGSLHKNIQLILEFLKVPSMVLLYINHLPDDVICDIAIYADDTTLYSKFDQASDLWQQLDFVSELESDIRDT